MARDIRTRDTILDLPTDRAGRRAETRRPVAARRTLLSVGAPWTTAGRGRRPAGRAARPTPAVISACNGSDNTSATCSARTCRGRGRGRPAAAGARTAPAGRGRENSPGVYTYLRPRPDIVICAEECIQKLLKLVEVCRHCYRTNEAKRTLARVDRHSTWPTSHGEMSPSARGRCQYTPLR